jgi:hypothetical protein
MELSEILSEQNRLQRELKRSQELVVSSTELLERSREEYRKEFGDLADYYYYYDRDRTVWEKLSGNLGLGLIFKVLFDALIAPLILIPYFNLPVYHDFSPIEEQVSLVLQFMAGIALLDNSKLLRAMFPDKNNKKFEELVNIDQETEIDLKDK